MAGAGVMDDATLGVFETDRAMALEQHAVRQSADLDLQIGPAHRRAQIGDGRTAPSLVAHRDLQRADAILLGAVEVVVARIAGLDRGSDKAVMQFVLGAQIGDVQRAGGPMMLVSAALLSFGAAEIGQHVLIRPAGVAELAPQIEILALAADIDQPVDRARTAEDLAARPWQPAAAQFGLRLGLELPGDLGVVNVAVKSGWNVDPRVAVLAAGFEQQHADARVGAEPVG